MMSPHRVAARLDAIYRGIGIGLAGEMMARGVLTLLAYLGQNTVFSVTASWSFPFTLIGGCLILTCHISKAEQPWRYIVGALGHALGLIWAFMFGAAIVIGWYLGTAPSALSAPMFLFGAALHGTFFYTSVKGAKWTRKLSV